MKAPIKDVVDANSRGKTCKIVAIVSFGLFIVCGLFSYFLNGILNALSVIVALISFCVGVVFAIFSNTFSRYAKQLKTALVNLTCSNCKAKIKYDENTKIETVKKQFDVTKSFPGPKDGKFHGKVRVVGIETVLVKITCKCQKCGETKSFLETFTTLRCYKEESNISTKPTADKILADMERDLRAEWKNGFDGSVTGASIDYQQSISQLVLDYFDEKMQVSHNIPSFLK